MAAPHPPQLLIGENGSTPATIHKDAKQFRQSVTSEFNELRPVHVVFDPNRLTVRDLKTIMKIQDGEANQLEMIDILDKAIVNMDIDDLPFHAIESVTEQLMDSIGGASDPND